MFRSTSTSRVERALNAEHRILCAWAMFSKVFSKSHVFERTKKRWTKRTKIDRHVDRKNDEKSFEKLIDDMIEQTIDKRLDKRLGQLEKTVPGGSRTASRSGKTTSAGPSRAKKRSPNARRAGERIFLVSRTQSVRTSWRNAAQRGSARGRAPRNHV